MKYVLKAAGDSLTLGELRELVAKLDIEQASDRSVVRVRQRFGGRASEISVDPDEQLIEES